MSRLKNRRRHREEEQEVLLPVDQLVEEGIEEMLSALDSSDPAQIRTAHYGITPSTLKLRAIDVKRATPIVNGLESVLSVHSHRVQLLVVGMLLATISERLCGDQGIEDLTPQESVALVALLVGNALTQGTDSYSDLDPPRDQDLDENFDVALDPEDDDHDASITDEFDDPDPEVTPYSPEGEHLAEAALARLGGRPAHEQPPEEDAPRYAEGSDGSGPRSVVQDPSRVGVGIDSIPPQQGSHEQ